MWKNLNGFNYKTMAFTNSCFPCVMHIIYANLGKMGASGDEIEDEWNTMHPGGLNASAPTFTQVVSYLAGSKYQLADNFSFYTQDNFGSYPATVKIMNNIADRFVKNGQEGSGMVIAAGGHAVVFFRTKDNKTFFYYPFREENLAEDWCYEIEIDEVDAIDCGNNKFEIGIKFKDKNGGHELAYTTNFVMLIN